MTGNKAIVQSLILTPPRAFGETGPFGQVIVFNVGVTPQVLDLRSLTFGLYFDPTNAQTNNAKGAPAAGAVGAVGSYICIYADGCDLGVVTGVSLASVSGSNAPNLTQTGVLNSDGTYQGIGGTCYRIPATVMNDEPRWRLMVGVDNWLGIVGSAAGICRLYVSSEMGLQS